MQANESSIMALRRISFDDFLIESKRPTSLDLNSAQNHNLKIACYLKGNQEVFDNKLNVDMPKVISVHLKKLPFLNVISFRDAEFPPLAIFLIIS